MAAPPALPTVPGFGPSCIADAAVDAEIDAAGRNLAVAVIADFGDAEKARLTGMGERDDIAGLQCEIARRQGEGCLFARGPSFVQPGLAVTH